MHEWVPMVAPDLQNIRQVLRMTLEFLYCMKNLKIVAKLAYNTVQKLFKLLFASIVELL